MPITLIEAQQEQALNNYIEDVIKHMALQDRQNAN
jgi:hypothetical protein